MEPVSKVQVAISVVLGTAEIPIHQLLRLGRGAMIELDATERDDVTILANNVGIARGRIVLDGEHIRIAVTEVLARSPAFRVREAIEVAG